MRAIKTAFVTSLVLALLVALVLFFKKISHKPSLKENTSTSSVEPDTTPSPSYLPPEKPIDDDIAEQSPINETIIIPYEPSIVDGTKQATTKIDHFIHGAVMQYGVTNSYNGAYKKIAYPNGDVDITTGVCTDVIVRAFRAMDIDLQKEIHRDMRRNFRKYPRKWGLRSPDANIDHRRVPNMETYFTRKGYKLPLKPKGDYSQYKPGDLVIWRIRNNMTHIGIVSDQKVPGTSRYYIIHNPFQGVEISDWLVEFEIINHFRVFRKESV